MAINFVTYCHYVSRKDFTDEFGASGVHIMKECMFPFNIALGLQKDSPYRTRYEECLFFVNFAMGLKKDFPYRTRYIECMFPFNIALRLTKDSLYRTR